MSNRLQLPRTFWIGLLGMGAACLDASGGKDAPPKPAAKHAPAPLSAQPMRGPFADLRGFCKTLKPAPEKCLTEALDAEGNGFFALKVARPPYRAVRVFSTGSVGWYSFNLGIQTDKGWYVQSIIEAITDTKVRDLTIDESVPSAGPLVRVRLVGANLMPAGPGSERTIQMCFEQATVCGVGKSGTPSCVPPLRVASSVCQSYDGSTPMPPWDWEISLALRKDGQLELAGSGQLDFTAPRELLGTHSVYFP